MFGDSLNNQLKAASGFVRLAEFAKKVAHIYPRSPIVWLELDGPAEVMQRLGNMACHGQKCAVIKMELRVLRIHLTCTLKGSFGLIVAPPAKENLAKGRMGKCAVICALTKSLKKYLMKYPIF